MSEKFHFVLLESQSYTGFQMDSQPLNPPKPTCRFEINHGELCKNRVREDGNRCWRHANGSINKLKSLARDHTFGFAISLLSLMATLLFGLAGLYISLVGGHGTQIQTNEHTTGNAKTSGANSPADTGSHNSVNYNQTPPEQKAPPEQKPSPSKKD